ncbi:MAG: hypothetical protein ABIL25_04760 [candidate division WOR-3 bacterium]
MKRSLLLAVVLVGLAVLSTSCDIFGGKADYYPLSIGSIWNYSWRMTVNDSVWASGTLKVEAVKEEQLTSGEKVVMLVSTSTGGTDTSYARKDGEKVWSYSALNDTSPDLAFDGPPAIDKTWNVNEAVTAKIVAKENVTVAAGTYKNCWKIELTTITDADTTKSHMWLADGTGHVKSYAEEESGGITMKMTVELTSATIK